MAHRHFPGETIGIIGSSLSSAFLAQAAGALGYQVGSLVHESNNPVQQFASWQEIHSVFTEAHLVQFAKQVDTVYVELGLLTSQDFTILAEHTDLVLSENLITISTDRLIEKAYLDSSKTLVTPFSMVTSLEDINEAVEYLGYPCVLKSSQRHLAHANDHLLLFGEEDLIKAEDKVNSGTCILEAWIPVEKKVSLTVVRNDRGDTLIYPPLELIDKGMTTGKQVRYPARINQTLQKELDRIGAQTAKAVNLVGALTFEFFITSAGVIYINHASIGLGEAAIFTKGFFSVSQFEACVRALAGLSLPNIEPLNQAGVGIPMQQAKFDKVMVQFASRTDWGFVFANISDPSGTRLVGQIVVTGDSLESCDRQIDMTELYH